MPAILIKYLYRSIPVVMIGMLFSCENDLAQIEALNANENSPMLTSYDADITYTDSGIKVVRLIAPQLDQYNNEEEQMVAPNHFDLRFYDEQGNPNAQLTGKRGIYMPEKGIFEAFDSVEMRMGDSVKVNSEYLTWVRDSAKIFTDKFVKVTRSEFILYGKGLVATEDGRQCDILEPKGRIAIKKGEDPDLMIKD